MICRIYDVKGGTVEHYEAVVERTGKDKPSGVHAHIMGVTDDGFKVIEVSGLGRGHRAATWTGLGQAIEDVMKDAQVPEPSISEFEVHRLDWLG